MKNKIEEISFVDSVTLYFRYSCGECGNLDLSNILVDDRLKALRDPEYLKRASIDKKTGDLIWPNGESMCKNAIYKILTMRNVLSSFKIDLKNL